MLATCFCSTPVIWAQVFLWFSQLILLYDLLNFHHSLQPLHFTLFSLPRQSTHLLQDPAFIAKHLSSVPSFLLYVNSAHCICLWQAMAHLMELTFVFYWLALLPYHKHYLPIHQPLCSETVFVLCCYQKIRRSTQKHECSNSCGFLLCHLCLFNSI